MKRLKYITLTAIAIVGLACQSEADLIDLGLILPPPANPIGNEQAEADFLETHLSLNFQLQPVLPKIEFDPSPSSTQISWDLTGTGLQLDFVLAKDGSGTVGGVTGQLYHLYGVTVDQKTTSNGLQTVTIDGNKGISHITFLGQPAVPGVPDGGTTIMLLGGAFACLGALRRRIG